MGAFFHRHRGTTPYLLLAPGILWLAIFFLIPLGFLGYQSLQSGLFPDFQFTWEFSNFSDGIRDYHEQLVRSFVYAGIATVACLVLAYPLVYWIAFRCRAVAEPPPALHHRALLRHVPRPDARVAQHPRRPGPVVGLLRDLHILGPDGRLLATTFAVISGITYNFFPFMALPLYVSLEQIDPRLLEAAKDLYASSTQAFLRVTLPLSAPGIVAGTLLTFIPAAGDFINAALLGTPNQAMIGNVIQAKFLESLDYPGAASLSFILMGLILVALLVYARIVGSERLTG
jgi:spermidine/putrescine transport system permease protein